MPICNKHRIPNFEYEEHLKECPICAGEKMTYAKKGEKKNEKNKRNANLRR